MCLALRKTDSDKPYNRGRIRYKVARRMPMLYMNGGSIYDANGNAIYSNRLRGLYVCDFQYAKSGKWMRARHRYGRVRSLWDHSTGFHVYVNKSSAIGAMRKDGNSRRNVVIRVRVDDFNASGRFDDGSRAPMETWRRMMVLGIVNTKRRRKKRA